MDLSCLCRGRRIVAFCCLSCRDYVNRRWVSSSLGNNCRRGPYQHLKLVGQPDYSTFGGSLCTSSGHSSSTSSRISSETSERRSVSSRRKRQAFASSHLRALASAFQKSGSCKCSVRARSCSPLYPSFCSRSFTFHQRYRYPPLSAASLIACWTCFIAQFIQASIACFQQTVSWHYADAKLDVGGTASSGP